MSALLFAILSNKFVLAIGGGFVAAVIAYMRGRISGGARERAKRDREELKAVKEAREIEDAIAGRSPDENRKRLKTWGET